VDFTNKIFDNNENLTLHFKFIFLLKSLERRNMNMKKIIKKIVLFSPILALFLLASCDLKIKNKRIEYTLNEEKDGYIVSRVNNVLFPKKKNKPVFGNITPQNLGNREL